ncbi:hypothetical protein JK165_08075 [Acetobacter okinawensis]|nr:hypothetical protein [Acetobacter okinawensis]MBS0989489.1 hypothetical protein [Acetobacter okinawensis]
MSFVISYRLAGLSTSCDGSGCRVWVAWAEAVATRLPSGLSRSR